MIIKTLFLASFMIASALATGEEGNKPFPAALLVKSNFDFSLIPKEFRVHYGGPKEDSTEVSIKIYRPDGGLEHTYKLEGDEKKTKQAFHFALDKVVAGAYEVEVCADNVCSAKSPSLTDVTTTSTHKISCEGKDSIPIEVDFVEPLDSNWTKPEEYGDFSNKINTAYGITTYQTDFKKYNMVENPSYKRSEKIFHAAIMHDLRQYRPFFTEKAPEYCGRNNMLSLHCHIIDKDTKKVIYRSKTVNHLSEDGKKLFILEETGPILLESTHKNVDVPKGGNYEVWVSLCVTDKDAIESTYCASPIKKALTEV